MLSLSFQDAAVYVSFHPLSTRWKMKCPIHEKALTWYLCTDEICFSIHFKACLAEKVPYMSHKEKNSDDSVKIVKFMEKIQLGGGGKSLLSH